MNTIFKGDNKNLLVLGGLALAAAYFLMNRSTTPADSGGGSGAAGSLLRGLTPTAPQTPVTTESTLPGSPIVYQFPPEATVNFPQQASDGMADLLKLLTGGPAATAEATTTTKKEAATAGSSDGSVKYVVDSNGKVWQPIADSGGLFATVLGGKIGNVNGGGTLPTYSEGGIDYTPSPLMDAATTSTKKEMFVSGFSGQYVDDNGTLYWNPLNGYGLSTDPKTDQKVSYQRDIFIGDASGTTYAPDGSIGTKKESYQVIDWSNNQNFGYSRELDSTERAKVAAQADPNYVVGSWVDPGVTKKEASISTDSGSGGSSSPGNSYSAETAASAPAGIDMSSSPMSGGSWDDYW